MNAVLVVIQFLVLAFRASSRPASWVTAFALTALVHGWWLAKGIEYQRAPDGSGFGMPDALMMLVSPLPIALIAFGIDSALRWRATSD